MGRGARVADLPTEDIEDIWAELDDLSDEIEGVKDSVGLLLMSDESVQAIRKRKTGGFAAPRHSQTPTKARSQRAKPASPVTFTARMTVIGSNAPHNAPLSPS